MYRVIETVDGLGIKTRRKIYGSMATTEHNKILSILERRARRFRPELRQVIEQEQLDTSLDETGTLLNFEADMEARERERQAQLEEENSIRDIRDEVLEIHGKVPGKKGEGVIRLLYENANGFDGRFSNNMKVDKAKDNPCGNDKPNSGTVYHQHREYWVTKRHSLVCPRVKFREDLLAQLRQWREEGDKLVVCLDANEDIYKKSIGRALTDIDGLAMQEVVGAFTGSDIGPTYFRGSKPIDAVWATTDVQVVGASIMPAGFGVGDHRLFVIDLLGSSLLGHAPKKIVRPQARRLNCKLAKSVEKYTTRLEQKILKHRLIERTGRVYTSGVSGAEAKQQLDVIDRESKNYMTNAEEKCRTIKSGCIPFSPESAKWIRRCQVYRSLL